MVRASIARISRELPSSLSQCPHPNPLPKGEGTKHTNPLPSPLSSLPAPLSSITHVGTDGNRLFAAAPWVEGRTAAEWMVHHGRFPPEVVLEIARAMLAGLIELEQSRHLPRRREHVEPDADRCRRRVVLMLPGLRGILRPEEGYAHADLLPEAYDSLAPERVSAGTPPNALSDIYACGCVWWHLLCGRPPLAGGNSLAKLRAAQAGEICDVRRYAPDVPAAVGGGDFGLFAAGTEPPAGVAGPAGRHARPADARRKRGVGRLPGPGRPAHRPLDDHRPLDPPIESHATLDRRRGVLLGGGRGDSLADLARTSRRSTSAALRRGQWQFRAKRKAIGPVPGRVPITEQARSRPMPDLRTITASCRPPISRSRRSRRIWCLPPTSRLTPRRSTCGPASASAGRRANGRRCSFPTPAWSSTRKTSVSRTSTSFGARRGRRRRATREPAIVQLLASRAEFRGCSFRCDETGKSARRRHSLGASGAERRDGNLVAQRPDPVGRLSVPPRRRGIGLPHDRSAGHRVEKRVALRRRAAGATGSLSAGGRAGVDCRSGK